MEIYLVQRDGPLGGVDQWYLDMPMWSDDAFHPIPDSELKVVGRRYRPVPPCPVS